MLLAIIVGAIVGAGGGFGVVEAVLLPILIGVSVQYSVHIAHAYHHSVLRTTHDRARSALISRGGSVFNAAAITVLCALVLLPCEVTLVPAFAAGVVLIALCSLACALVLFPALLMQFGPQMRRRLVDS